jgi:hypothetical protein
MQNGDMNAMQVKIILLKVVTDVFFYMYRPHDMCVTILYIMGVGHTRNSVQRHKLTESNHSKNSEILKVRKPLCSKPPREGER